MSDSLKDQLLALGLAPKKPAPKKGQPAKGKRKSTAGRKPDPASVSLDEAYKLREREEQRQKSADTARKRELERRRREVNNKLKAIVEAHAVRDEEADTKRHFMYKGRIRNVLATREQITAINEGTLGVLYLRGNYHLVPSSVIEEVQAFAPDHIPDMVGEEREEEQEHPVPDDLIW
jgi:uncharacterized protein YaiL (DUF2058 family)